MKQLATPKPMRLRPEQPDQEITLIHEFID